MVETRCPHGFFRSAVACPTCDRADVRSGTSPARTTRKRGEGEVLNLPGFYTCCNCGQSKPIPEFYASRTSPRGHQSRCKVCDNSKRVRIERRSGRGA